MSRQEQAEKPAVELKLMKRVDGSQYFEVWVRSSARPWLRQGTIVEREQGSSRQIVLSAGALAESLCDKYGDNRDSCDVAKAAQQAINEMTFENPILSDEGRLIQ